MVNFDREYMGLGVRHVAGIDEAGRGPLAGPVSVAIVVMPLEEDKIVQGVNDSKKLTEKKREALYDEIISKAIAYHVELIDEKVIDAINILNATKLGMVNCIEALKGKFDIALIDAVKLDNMDVPTESIVKGDAKSYNIACASILAKVTRDRLMMEMDKKYPQYNFAKHKGYGTKEHYEAINKFGKCDIHRETFLKKMH
ncbi:MAG: ribonuclease HII [Clostridiales bacterium]|nr:ribonuclease HII [Clostridiales bacterium]